MHQTILGIFQLLWVIRKRQQEYHDLDRSNFVKRTHSIVYGTARNMAMINSLNLLPFRLLDQNLKTFYKDKTLTQ